jgi:septal ring factor EnvC (AmiA/AmiB activator)
MRRAVLILFVVLFVCSPWALGSPDSLEDEIALQTKKLEELRKEQARLEGELKRVLSSAKDLSGELAKLEEQIAAAEADIAKSRERILALEKQRKQLEQEVESLQRGILKEKSSQEAIARGAYRVDTGEVVLRSLVSGISPGEWEANTYWAAQCLRVKSSTIEETRGDQAAHPP